MGPELPGVRHDLRDRACGAEHGDARGGRAVSGFEVTPAHPRSALKGPHLSFGGWSSCLACAISAAARSPFAASAVSAILALAVFWTWAASAGMRSIRA